MQTEYRNSLVLEETLPVPEPDALTPPATPQPEIDFVGD
jgi:hypothetical protein